MNVMIPGISVLGGVSQDGEPASHFAVHDEVLRASFCFVSLSGEYPEQAIERLGLVARVGVAGGPSEISERPSGLGD